MQATSATTGNDGLRALVEDGSMDAGWARALAPVADDIGRMGRFLEAETAAGRPFLPAGRNVLRAFRQPFDAVRVLVVGQDPYPTPGHPIGLSFAVDRSVWPLPRSLANIYRELEDDLGIPPAPHGDLTRWTTQGVVLLNRSLNVQAGKPASHRGRGWERITECAIRALADRDAPLVAILWGRDAGTARAFLGSAPVLASPHPSPLSAGRGFFGSRPFSGVNRLLEEQGAAPIDWHVDDWDAPGAAASGSGA